MSETEYARVVSATLDEFPRFKIVRKQDSWFMKVLNTLLLVVTAGQMRIFMTKFVTTIGSVMWVPEGWNDWSPFARAAVLRHERVHLRQQRRLGMPLYVLMYLLFPLPIGLAWGRAQLEKEAYAESIRAYHEYWGQGFFTDDVRELMIRYFTSAEYGWMWPFRRSIEKWYDRTVAMSLPF